ncbi:ABC transporter ATP-binding protein [Archaeoglobales archaeon]|nr:MAG: ABC transporter ATP-binding protein [Archaeoglobales archaeon]
MNEILKTKNLSKFFYGLKALDKVNIEVEKGKLTLVIGPNGSGKTTLINVISGFYKADEGQVLFNGNDITNKPPHEIHKHGVVRTFQIPQPLKKLTVLENLLIAEQNPGEMILNSLTKKWVEREGEIVEKAYNFLEFLGLDHLWDSEAYKLSGGQLKLLEVGRALMANAKLVVMDEPIAGVNPVLANNILDRITELKKQGITFLIVEHRLDIVLKYIDHIYVMANGRVIAEGDADEILNNREVIEVYLGATDEAVKCGV